MMRLVFLVSGFLGALGWSVPALAQTTVTFQQGKNGYSGAMDTYIDQFMPTDFYGGVERIEVRYYDDGTGLSEKQNALIRFDVSSIPSTATVTSAKLTLYNIRANSNGANDILVLEKVTSAWNNQSTWSMGVPSAVASGVTCPTVAGYTQAPTAPEVYTITGMASLVQGWLASPATNYGIMLSCASNLNLRFASSDYPNAGTYSQYRPELEVTYTTGPPPGPPPTVTVTAPPANAPSTPITVTGTASASAPATVTQVSWSNSLSGASGTATGTTAWTATIPLVNGFNLITVTVTDSTGATSSTSFTVRYAAPKTSGGGGGGHKPCGFGAAEGAPGSFAVVALALALLLAAMSGRR